MTSVNVNEFWQFSLNYYAKVKPICLAWQNDFHANVNLLLLLCYLEQQKLSINGHTLGTLSQILTAYSNRITQRVRTLRRRVKMLSQFNTLQQQQLKHQLLQQLLAVELIAEQQEQQCLIQTLNTKPNQNTVIMKPSALLELYLQQLQQPICPQIGQQLTQLRQALKVLSVKS